MKYILKVSFALFLVSGLRPEAKAQESNKTERLQLANQMENSIQTELLNKWYPQCVDSLYGGFLSTFTYDFKPTGPQDKFIVTQARHTWTTAKASELYPGVSYYLKCSEIGFHFLRDVMWDKVYGGFYDLVDRQGKVKNNPKALKQAYGNAFAIYALSAYYKASGDTSALNLVKKAFLWMEDHSHDAIYGGYYQYLTREGKPYREIVIRYPPLMLAIKIRILPYIFLKRLQNSIAFGRSR